MLFSAAMRYRPTIIRVGIFALAALASAQVVPWLACAATWPAASPLLSACAAVAKRSVSPLTLVGLPLLVLALARGRWFCRNLCPTGSLLTGVGQIACLRRKPGASLRRFPALGPFLCLAMLGGALYGFPLLLHLDPLVQFNGFFSAWRGSGQTWTHWLPALSLIALVMITAIFPCLWCERICPLGALQALLGRAGKACRRLIGRPPAAPRPSPENTEWETKCPRPASDAEVGRRAFLCLALGAGFGWLMRWAGARRPGLPGPIRPPGAVSESMLKGLCARCGSCMRACPEGIIVPDLGAGGLGSLLTPRLDFSRSYCNEWCRVCTGACPTGAIGPLSLEAKRAGSIGVARVDRTRCLAWNDAEYCMVCHEFCSYQAIRIVAHNGVNCPEVEQDLCRGCGACQSQCPAEPRRAIVVFPRGQAPAPESLFQRRI